MKHFFPLFVLLFLCASWCNNNTLFAQNSHSIPPTALSLYPQQYNAFFEMAYQANPSVPRGVLEAIAYTNTRMYHLTPSADHQSCVGLPHAYGVMGLVENGKGWFNNNLVIAADNARSTVAMLKESPSANILAFAQYFAATQSALNVHSNKVEDNIDVIRRVSELPYTANVVNDFAMNSHLYAVLHFLQDPTFQNAYQLPAYKFKEAQIFGETNLALVSAKSIDLTHEFHSTTETINNNTKSEQTPSTPQYSQMACVMPSGPKEYSAAVTFDAPDVANYSNVVISPYTIAIHDVEGSYAGCISWFNNPSASVSAHYVMRSFDGQVTQMVCHRIKAYHVSSENPYAVGIEHEGYAAQGEVWYTNALYNSSATLCRFIADDLSINKLQTYDGPPISGLQPMSHTCTKIKGHQMFPGSGHSDPGPGWDWPRFYQLINNTLPTPTTSTTSTGTVYDSGGAAANYGNEERSTWLIQPTSGGSTITLTFSAYALEDTYDFLWIYDGTSPSGALIGKYSGTSPGTVTAYSGAIFMEFRSDCATTAAGWTANYTTSAAASCAMPTGLGSTPTALTANLAWTAVAGVSSYEVSYKRTTASTWTTFTTNSNSGVATGLTAGASYEWRVRSACSGSTYSAYAGATFVTNDVPTTQIGTAAITVNQCSGLFRDSGGTDWNYNHYESWTYTIAPTNATSVTMTFSSFNVEANYDYLYIYNGTSTSAPLLGTYTGTTSPGTVVANSGAMTLRFTSDNATYTAGWDASWTCTQPTCVPTSTINALNSWYTDDFTANFTDNACGTGTGFWQVQDYDGTEWRCNPTQGFFNDEFTTTAINSAWTNAAGTWSISNGALYQSVEATGTGDNTNLYASLTQNNSSTYLYSWDDKIGGTGTNRRAGIHFFCDDPTQTNRGNSYFVYYRVDNDKMQLYKVNANVFTMVLEVAVTVDPDVWYNHEISYNPQTGVINVYRNNALVGTWTDTAPLTAGIAISARSGNCTYNIDNLRVFKSRGSTATVSMGATTDMVRYQSPNSSTNAGKIMSLLVNNNHEWTSTDTKLFKADWTTPAAMTVNDGTSADIDQTTTNTQLSANWTASTDANSGITSYSYAIGTTSGGTNVLTWTSNGTATTFTQTLSLTYNQTYYVSVRATNGAGLTTTSTSDGLTILAPCGTPTGVAVSSITTTSATVSWTAVSGASSYTLQYRPTGGTWTSSNSTTNSINLSGLSSTTVYEVQVTATCASGTSNASSVATFTTLTPCGTPTGVAVSSITTTSATVSWTAVSGATSYTVQYRPTGGTWTSSNSTTNSINLSGLSSTTVYEVQVTATCASGTSNASSVATFTTLTPCGTPTGVAVSSITTTSATVSWTAVSGASSYTLQYRPTGGTWTSVVVTSNSANLTGLNSASTYEVQVATTCSSGNSAYSSSSSFTTLTPCGVPTGVVASSIATTSATVSWTAVSGATSYTLRYRPTGGTWTSVTVTTNTRTLTGLSASTVYEVQVLATCSSGNSAYSSSISFTTLTPCGVPASLSTTLITNTSARLNWVAVSGATSYTVKIRRVGFTTWSTYNVTTNYKQLGNVLTACKSYEWKVMATCPSGASAYSALRTFSTTGCGISGKSEDNLNEAAAIIPTLALQPNPANEWVQIFFEGIAQTESTISVYDIAGKLVYSTQYSNKDGENTTTISVDNLPSGCYFVEVVNSNGRVSEKLVVR
jgi:N-acetyl-anhydromuramyl-L-alanine amidase AmpD